MPTEHDSFDLATTPESSQPGDCWAWRWPGSDAWGSGRLLAIDHDAARALVRSDCDSLLAVDYLALADLDCWRPQEGRARG